MKLFSVDKFSVRLDIALEFRNTFAVFKRHVTDYLHVFF